MKRNTFFKLLTVVMLISLVLTACKPATPKSTAPHQAFAPMKVEAPNCDYGGEFKSIETIDENTVKFTLCYPDPAFTDKVAFAIFSIQDKAFLDINAGDSAKMSEKPNGTGPYIVKEWVRGDKLVLETNPKYWGTAPKTKTIVFRWSKESAQRLLELQSGTVDGIDNPGPDDIKTIEADKNLQFIARPPMNIFYIGMNNNIAPFDKLEVRKAFALAIDRKQIVDQFYPAGSEVASQFMPNMVTPGYSSNIAWYDYNPEEAKKMLTDAGFDFNQEITLSYRDVVRGYLPNVGQVAQNIQAQLAEIGVKVKLNVEESGTFLTSVSDSKEALYLLGWTADYPDATNFMDYHFTGVVERFGKVNPDLEKPIKDAGKIADPAERQKLYDQVNQIIKDTVPMIPVAHGGSGVAVKASVPGFKVGPLNENFEEVSNGTDTFVFMQNAEPISLWPSDETDGETIRPALLVYDALLSYELGGVKVNPSLAETYEANADLTEWTFHLRKGVTFHNGEALDAADVVASYAAQWDMKSPNHKGNTTTFEYFNAFFGQFLNAAQ